MIKKAFLAFILVSSFYCLVPRLVSAAIITINPKGQIIWQVLGDSTIQVKSVAENIILHNGKIELSDASKATNADLVEIQARGNTNDLKIGSNGNNFNIEENGITASTTFPITIDPIKNELTLTTPSGDRLISILPYEAMLSLTRGKFIDEVKGNQIKLGEDSNGALMYSIDGIKNVNLFNIATLKTDVSSTVSATNGDVIKINEPQWLKIFGFLWN